MYQPVRAPRHEHLTVRGLETRLTWWGEPSTAPVVLLHGFMDCGPTWQFLVDCLPKSWTCVAPDWRGFGGTQWAPQGYWFPDYFADLEALLEALVPGRRARVIAHSMGANIASMYAGIRPDRLEWLANLDGIGLPRVAAGEAPGRYERWLNELVDPPKGTRYESVAQLAESLLKRNGKLTLPRAQFIARAWSRDVADERDVVSLRFDPGHRVVNPMLFRRDEAEACWARMTIPMLLLRAGRSEFLARLGDDGLTERVQAQYRNVRIVSLPEAGHSMHHEDPQTVARHIIDFERDCAAAGAAAGTAASESAGAPAQSR